MSFQLFLDQHLSALNLKTRLFILIAVLLFSSCSDKVHLNFHYKYDKHKEQLDTTNDGINPWYLDAQKISYPILTRRMTANA